MTIQPIWDYWRDYFVCTQSAGCFFSSLWEGLMRMCTWWFGNSKVFVRMSVFVIPFVCIGFFYNGVRALFADRMRLLRLESVGLIVLGELFILGLLHKYPFTGERITLFLAPFVFYALIQGMSIAKKVPIVHKACVTLLCIFLFICGINTVWAFLKLY
jgi:hypothetical protein